jgi:hypothetical protein
MALQFTLKSILLRQKKKNYGNSNISPSMQKYNLRKKIPLKETKILQDMRTLKLSLKKKKRLSLFCS